MLTAPEGAGPTALNGAILVLPAPVVLEQLPPFDGDIVGPEQRYRLAQVPRQVLVVAVEQDCKAALQAFRVPIARESFGAAASTQRIVPTRIMMRSPLAGRAVRNAMSASLRVRSTTASPGSKAT